MISVIVITYNSEKTLIETLESIYRQTYEEIELIITDDGSKDQTVNISKAWIKEKGKRFVGTQILESVNTGVAKNCNRGINASKGEFIQIIAGDDILYPEAIEKKYNCAKENNLKIVFCKVRPFGNNIENVNKMIKFCEQGYKIIEEGYQAQKNAILNDNYIAGPSGGFYSSAYIKSIHGYDERYPMMEDYPFIYHYIYAGNTIYMLDEILADYRISDGSLCMKKGSPMGLSHAKFFFQERMIQMLREGKFGLVIKQAPRFMKKKIEYQIKTVR